MNKKVSTILTCGLMLGGSLLCSSAFAETIKLAKEPATKIEANKQYAIVHGTFVMPSSGTIAVPQISRMAAGKRNSAYCGNFLNAMYRRNANTAIETDIMSVALRFM